MAPSLRVLHSGTIWDFSGLKHLTVYTCAFAFIFIVYFMASIALSKTLHILTLRAGVWTKTIQVLIRATTQNFLHTFMHLHF